MPHGTAKTSISKYLYHIGKYLPTNLAAGALLRMHVKVQETLLQLALQRMIERKAVILDGTRRKGKQNGILFANRSGAVNVAKELGAGEARIADSDAELVLEERRHSVSESCRFAAVGFLRRTEDGEVGGRLTWALSLLA